MCQGGNTALILAAKDGHMEIVRVLKEWGAEKYTRNEVDGLMLVYGMHL